MDARKLSSVLQGLAESRDDERSWRELYRLCWPFVLATTYRYLRGHAHLAEDASQEVFSRLVLYCPFEELTAAEAFRRYLTTVCHNVSMDLLRELLSRAEDPEVEVGEVEEFLGRSSGIELQVEIADILDRLAEALDEEEILILRRVADGFSLAQIAEELGTTPGALAVRLHRLRKRMRSRIDEWEGGEAPG